MRLTSLVRASTSITALALSTALAQAQDAPVSPPPAAEADTIVVTGLRQSLQSATNIRRNSLQIVDAIVAEDIGKLPDITASAALARVPGVQVQRAAAEADRVQIRGLPDISTTYNGREIFTAENRFVAIQDFPAGAVAALEVFKSGSANLIEGGIGGQVNVRSRRPFDFDGFEVSGSLNGVHFEQSQALDWNGNLLVSGRWETGIGEMGLLVNAAMTNINFLDSTRENDRFITPEPGVTPGPGDFVRPNGQGIFYNRGDRWRPSANAAFQWRPTPELEIYVEGLFQGYRAKDRNHWLFVPTFGAGAQFSNVVLRDDGSNSVRSMTVTGAATPDGFDEFQRVRTNTYQVAGGATYNGDRLKLSADIAYTDSTYSVNQVNVDYAFASSPVRNVNFDVQQGTGGGTFDFVGFNAADPNNYLLRGVFDRRFRATGDDIQARADIQFDTGFDMLPKLEAGVRYNDRNASRQEGTDYRGLLQLGLRYPQLPLDIGHVGPGFRYDSLQPETLFPQPTFGSVFGNITDLRTLAGLPTTGPAFSPTAAFEASEEAYAGYVQARYAFDVGFPIDGAIGLRAVKTKTQINGTSFDPANGGTFNPVSQGNDYTDYLPNISLRAEFMPGFQFRAAYTETRTRPNFIDLSPSGTLSTPPSVCTPVVGDPSTGPDAPNCFVDFNGGNPNLQPLTSENYDVSLEYYFSRSGSLTVSAFRRDVNNFIFRNTVTQTVAGAPDIRLNTPFNGGKGRLQGIEASFTSFLDLEGLPEWAKGFGLQANYTYIDASTELAPGFRDRLPGQQRFPNVSKHAFNIVGMYERKELSARLAYNWRSKFVLEYQDLQRGFLSPLEQDSLGTLDFSASVTPVENITIAFDFLNILADPVKTDRAYGPEGYSYRFQTRYLERVYSLGVRFRF